MLLIFPTEKSILAERMFLMLHSVVETNIPEKHLLKVVFKGHTSPSLFFLIQLLLFWRPRQTLNLMTSASLNSSAVCVSCQICRLKGIFNVCVFDEQTGEWSESFEMTLKWFITKCVENIWPLTEIKCSQIALGLTWETKFICFVILLFWNIDSDWSVLHITGLLFPIRTQLPWIPLQRHDRGLMLHPCAT